VINLVKKYLISIRFKKQLNYLKIKIFNPEFSMDFYKNMQVI